MYNIIKTLERNHLLVEVDGGIKYIVGIYGEMPNVKYHAWEARYNEEKKKYYDRVTVHESKWYKKEGEDFGTFIEECIKVMHTCPECGKAIPLNEQVLVGFSNRCCEDCYPKLKKKLEYPGWTC